MSKDDRELIEALKVGTTFGLPYDPPRPNACVPNFPEADRLMRLAATRLEALQAQPGIVIDLDAEFWGMLKEAANQSTWLPPEYMMNDWVADCASFLRHGPAALTASPPVVEREALRARVCRLTMPKGEVIEVEYPTSSAWAKSWSVRYPPDMEVGATGEQDWELVERYGLTAILDAAILALTPVEGVGEREAAFNAGWAEAVQCIENEGPMAADHMARDTTWEAYLAALSTPVAQGEEVRDALEPFAEIARGEAFRKFADDAKSNLAICNPDGKRFAFINAECFDAALATLTKGARDAG